MNLRELRIGNLVNDDRNILTEVYSIDTEINHDDLTHKYSYVPITTEWLLKFGFEGEIHKESKCGNFYLGYNGEYYNHKMAIWHQKGSWCFSHTNQFTILKYVHQLQNLYFALTGEELVLNQGYLHQDSSENITLD